MDRGHLDTSTLSDIIQPVAKRLPVVAGHLRDYLRAHGRITFSEISCYEVLRGLRRKTAVTQLEQFELFCQRSELLSVNYRVLDQAATLWADGQRRGITVDDCDLIIAATALIEGLPLVSANTRHFA